MVEVVRQKEDDGTGVHALLHEATLAEALDQAGLSRSRRAERRDFDAQLRLRLRLLRRRSGAPRARRRVRRAAPLSPSAHDGGGEQRS